MLKSKSLLVSMESNLCPLEPKSIVFGGLIYLFEALVVVMFSPVLVHVLLDLWVVVTQLAYQLFAVLFLV